jgi:hypothetical protein
MSCHTWFYIPIEKVEYEITKKYLIDTLNNEIRFFEKYIKYPLNEDYLDILEDFPHWTIEYMQHKIDIWKRQLRLVEGGYCKEAVNKKFERSNKLIIYRNGNHYENSEFHDIFRKYNYPEIELYSYQETIDYISNVENRCNIYDYTMEQLKKFWNKYPNGMIRFG